MERIPNELCSGPGSQGDADALLHPDLVLLPLAVTASSSRAAGPRRLGLLGTESHNQLVAGGQIGTLLTLRPPWEGNSSQPPVLAPVSMTTTQLKFPGHFHFKGSVHRFPQVPVTYSVFPFSAGK